MSEEGNGQEANLPETINDGNGGEREKTKGSPIEPEVLRNLPPDVRKAVESFSLQAFSAPVFHPVLTKINEEHIDKVLDQAEKDSQRNYDDTQSTKKYHLIYTIIVLVFLGLMTVFLVRADKELYKEVLKLLLPFLAGLAGGYGIKAYQDREKD